MQTVIHFQAVVLKVSGFILSVLYYGGKRLRLMCVVDREEKSLETTRHVIESCTHNVKFSTRTHKNQFLILFPCASLLQNKYMWSTTLRV